MKFPPTDKRRHNSARLGVQQILRQQAATSHPNLSRAVQGLHQLMRPADTYCSEGAVLQYSLLAQQRSTDSVQTVVRLVTVARLDNSLQTH